MLEFLKRLFQRTRSRPENTGVIVENKPTDYFVNPVAGQVTSPIAYKIRLTDGNWTPYAFDQENQFNSKGDALDCVAESFINAIQAQEFFLTGKKVQYSKRWLAKISGTNQGIYKGRGNTYSNVADAIKNIGLVLEADYPKPTAWTVDEFYAEIPEPLYTQLMNKAAGWRAKWNYQYEFLQVTDPNLDYHLKHSPIDVIIPGHSICGIYSPIDWMHYVDSYPPYAKTTPVSALAAAMKGILTPKTIFAREVGWQGSPELGLYLPYDSMQRRDFIRQNIATWLPDYAVDESKTYPIAIKKPNFN